MEEKRMKKSRESIRVNFFLVCRDLQRVAKEKDV